MIYSMNPQNIGDLCHCFPTISMIPDWVNNMMSVEPKNVGVSESGALWKKSNGLEPHFPKMAIKRSADFQRCPCISYFRTDLWPALATWCWYRIAMIWVGTITIYSNVLHPENTLEQSAANMSSVNLGFKQKNMGLPVWRVACPIDNNPQMNRSW